MLRITKPTYDDDQAGILPISDVHNLLEVEGDQTRYLFDYLTSNVIETTQPIYDLSSKNSSDDRFRNHTEEPSRFLNFSAILKRIAKETSWHIGLLNPTVQDKHIDTYYLQSQKHSLFTKPFYAYLYSPDDLYTAARVGVNATGSGS